MDHAPNPPVCYNLPEDITAIGSLADGATRGPWTVTTITYSSEGGRYNASHIPGVCEEVPGCYDCESYGPLRPADAHFIAAARVYVPASIVEIRALRSAVADLEQERDALRSEIARIKAGVSDESDRR